MAVVARARSKNRRLFETHMSNHFSLRVACVIALAAVAGCDGVLHREPDCLDGARSGAETLASLPAKARAFVADAVGSECALRGVACTYRVLPLDAGALRGEISVAVDFVRADDDGCIYLPGDGKAWQFTADGELIGPLWVL